MNYNEVELSYVCGNPSQLPKSDKPEIVFSGKSNVGKSSLINKIINRKSFARTSATPGKTGTINFYELKDIFLVDLPGYGYAKVSFSEKKRWALLVESYLASQRNKKLVIQIIDIRHKPSSDDLKMISYLNETNTPFIVVFTKSDKLSSPKKLERINNFKDEIPHFEDINFIIFSSVTAEGLDELRSTIENTIA